MGLTPWVRHTPERAMNKKLRAAGFAARGLDDAAICQVASDDSDGFISVESVHTLAVAHKEKSWSRLVVILVREGRWVEVEGGWLIHDYEQYNMTREYWARQREQQQEKGRRGGLARAQAAAKANAPPAAQAAAKPRAQANGQPASLRYEVAKDHHPQGDAGQEPGSGSDDALIEAALNILADRRMSALTKPVLNPVAYRRVVLDGLTRDYAHMLTDDVRPRCDTPQALAAWLEPAPVVVPSNFAPGSGRLPNWSLGES